MSVSEIYGGSYQKYQNKTTNNDSKTNNTSSEDTSQDIKNYDAIFHQKMVEMSEKFRNGETQQKIQIGRNAYTVKEWKKLLTGFDKAQEQIREEIEEEVRIRMEKKRAEEIRKKLENISDSEIAALVGDEGKNDI